MKLKFKVEKRRMKEKSMRLVVFGIVLVLLASGIGTVSAFSNSGDGDWKYYKEITVKENSGKTLTNFQVLVDLNPSNFPANAKSDGSDLRFEDSNGKELNYWIEEWDYGAKKAKIWVKVPSIPANGETMIRMYYGNDKASAVSDGDKVFEFFDDFDSGFNPTKWSVREGSLEYPTGVAKSDGCKVESVTKGGRTSNWLHIWNTGGSGESGGTVVLTEVEPYAQCIVELKYAIETLTGSNYQILHDEDGETILGIYAPAGPDNVADGKSLYYYNRDDLGKGRFSEYKDTDYDLLPDVLYRFRYEVSSTNDIYGWFNEYSLGDVAFTDKARKRLGLIAFNARHEGCNFWVDNIVVRKYAPTEPTLTFSAEYPTTAPTPIVPTQPLPKESPLISVEKVASSSDVAYLELIYNPKLQNYYGYEVHLSNPNLKVSVPEDYSISYIAPIKVKGQDIGGKLIIWAGTTAIDVTLGVPVASFAKTLYDTFNKDGSTTNVKKVELNNFLSDEIIPCSYTESFISGNKDIFIVQIISKVPTKDWKIYYQTTVDYKNLSDPSYEGTRKEPPKLSGTFLQSGEITINKEVIDHEWSFTNGNELIPEIPTEERATSDVPVPEGEEVTPTPGFEALFTIAGLLAVTYVLRRKK